jgi:hypothetical protein
MLSQGLYYCLAPLRLNLDGATVGKTPTSSTFTNIYEMAQGQGTAGARFFYIGIKPRVHRTELPNYTQRITHPTAPSFSGVAVNTVVSFMKL